MQGQSHPLGEQALSACSHELLRLRIQGGLMMKPKHKAALFIGGLALFYVSVKCGAWTGLAGSTGMIASVVIG